MRKIFLNPVGLIGAAAVVLGIVIGQPLIAVAGAMVYVGSVVLNAITHAQTRNGPHPSELSAEGRMLLRPLRQIHDSLEQVVRANQHVPEIKVIGEEALIESQAIMTHVVSLVQTRSGMKKTMRGKSEAQLAKTRLERDLSNATSDSERESLRAAILATEEQIQEYEKLQKAMDTIIARIKEAQATLSTLKAQMISGLATSQHEDLQNSEMDGMVQRLRDLNRSLDEAQSMSQGQTL